MSLNTVPKPEIARETLFWKQLRQPVPLEIAPVSADSLANVDAVPRVSRMASSRELCAKAVKVARYTPEEWAELKAFGNRLYPRADGEPDPAAWRDRPATVDESWRGAPQAHTWRQWIRIAEQLRALQARRQKAGRGPTVVEALARFNRIKQAAGLPPKRSLRSRIRDLEQIMFG